MKKTIFVITLGFFCFHCFSQERSKRRPVIETNILNLVMRGPSIGLDIPVSQKISIMTSAAYGKFDWGIFGGLRTYKSIEADVKRHARNIYYGGYIKHTAKTVYSEQQIVAQYIPITSDRNFKGQGLAIGLSTGIEAPGKKWDVDFNCQLGYGKYYKMTEQFLYNLPSPDFIDFRMALWIGYRL